MRKYLWGSLGVKLSYLEKGGGAPPEILHTHTHTHTHTPHHHLIEDFVERKTQKEWQAAIIIATVYMGQILHISADDHATAYS